MGFKARVDLLLAYFIARMQWIHLYSRYESQLRFLINERMN